MERNTATIRFQLSCCLNRKRESYKLGEIAFQRGTSINHIHIMQSTILKAFLDDPVTSSSDSMSVKFARELVKQLGWFIATAGGMIVGLALNEAVKMSIDFGIPPDKVKKTLAIKWTYFAVAFIFFVILVTLFSLAVKSFSHDTLN